MIRLRRRYKNCTRLSADFIGINTRLTLERKVHGFGTVDPSGGRNALLSDFFIALLSRGTSLSPYFLHPHASTCWRQGSSPAPSRVSSCSEGDRGRGGILPEQTRSSSRMRRSFDVRHYRGQRIRPAWPRRPHPASCSPNAGNLTSATLVAFACFIVSFRCAGPDPLPVR